MAFVARECPENQYSVTGLDEFDQPIGSWAELVEFARGILAADADARADVPCPVEIPCPACKGGGGVAPMTAYHG